MMLNQQTVQQ